MNNKAQFSQPEVTTFAIQSPVHTLRFYRDARFIIGMPPML